jgi:dCMP deaminase
MKACIIGNIENYCPPTWDELFMKDVYNYASKSKDPRTKIGAVLVIKGHSPLRGFNGIPAGVEDTEERLTKPEKYFWIEHAERNVINMAAKLGYSTSGGILYTQGMPCVDCARGIVNCEIKEIVLHQQWESISTECVEGRPWAEHYWRSGVMFKEAGISVRYLDSFLNVRGYLDGKVLVV